MRTRCLKQAFTFATALAALTIIPGGAAATTESQSLLTQAYALTAKGDHTAAEATYRQLLQANPADGYPAYARYLARTGKTTATAQLLASPEFSAQPPLVRARTLVQAGERQKAIQALKQESDTSTHTLYAKTLLLVNQLNSLGETEQASRQLEQAVQSPRLTGADRRDLFQHLLRIGGPTHLAEVLPQLAETIVTSSTITYVQARTMFVDALTVLGVGDNYADFHSKLMERAATPALAWLFALSNLKKGDTDAAASALDSVTSTVLTPRQSAFILEEKARLYSQDSSKALPLYEELLKVTDDPNRIRLALAQQYFRQRDFAKVNRILDPIDMNALPEIEHQTALNMYLTSLGAAGAVQPLVEEFVTLTRDLPYEKTRDLSAAPFLMFSPDHVQPLRDALEQASKAPEASPNLFILQMALENQDDNTSGVLEALARYSRQQPENVDAAQELADALAAVAWQVTTENPTTSPPLEQLQPAGDAASKALWRVIRLRPYAPEPYSKLMALYTLYNQPEQARAVPLFLADRPNATAEEVHLAGYIYATNGMPELALPLYERALKQDNLPRYRINYAAALGRVGRVDEALAIYRDIIKAGVNGRQYTLGDLHSSALQLARRHGREKQHLDFLHGLLTDPDVAERKAFLLEEGQVLASAHLPNEALKFFDSYREEFPEDAAAATDLIVGTYAEMRQFDVARQILKDEIARTTAPEEVALLRNNFAIIYRVEGKVDEAVAEWQKLAADMPTQRTATAGLINAATLLTQSGQINRARELLKKYLALNTGDVTSEQVAREELAKLERLDVPAERLLDSAILEYGPGNP